MRFKYSLAYPYIIIISSVAAVTLCIGYYLNLNSLRDTIAARETDRYKSIARAAKEKISDEINEIKVYSQFLQKNSQLLDALISYHVRGDAEPLKQALDILYAPLAVTEVDIFLVADQKDIHLR